MKIKCYIIKCITSLGINEYYRFDVKFNINRPKLSKKFSSHYVSYVVWCRGNLIRGPARDWQNNRLPPAATPATPG